MPASAPPGEPRPEPITEAVARWARLASTRLLAAAALLGAGTAAAVLLLDWHWWPAAALSIAVAAFGIWGTLERHYPRPHSLLVRAAKGAAVALGAAGVVVGALGLLFWLLGPAPIL